MKFGEFFKKYTLCGLIYSAISLLMGFGIFAALYAIGKKEQNELDKGIQEDLKNLSNSSEEEE